MSLGYLNLEVKALQFFETSLTSYKSTRCNIPEDFNLQQHRCENLKAAKGTYTTHKISFHSSQRTQRLSFRSFCG
jgi:hypothetical protein